MLFALLEWFTIKPLPKILIVSALVGLAAGYHIRVASTYYRSTLRQNQFYWQLYWRAPYLKPGTAILSADELFLYVGRLASGTTMNLIYPKPLDSQDLGYWFFELDHDIGPKSVPKLIKGRDLSATFRNFTFKGNSLDNLVVNKAGNGRCLWVLSPQDVDNPDLPELTKLALPVANLSRIEPEPVAGDYPAQDLFGKEPAHDWCYYFQKADLARQFDDWQKVAQLGDEAQEKGYAAQDANEWLPFIQGYAFTGQWEKAIDRSRQAFTLKAEIAPRLCNTWSGILSRATFDADGMEQLKHFETELACPLQ
jgi:hypothetical protein